MTRIDTFLLLMLAGLGWACAYALIGLLLFKGVPDNQALAIIFAELGFGAGVLVASLRLALEQQLPQSLASGLRAQAEVGAGQALTSRPHLHRQASVV